MFTAGNLSGGLARDLAVCDGGIGFSITVDDIALTLKAIEAR